MMSTPCASSEASMSVCCLVRMARVMVKMTAWTIVRPRASSSSATSCSARPPTVASSVVARIGVMTRSAWEIARDTRREATPSMSMTTRRPSRSCN